MTDRRLEEALRHLNPAPRLKLWHGGPTLIGALRGVGVATALWKPSPTRHSLSGLALHIAYWNYAVTRRISDAPRGGFPRSPSNWPDVPTNGSEALWKQDTDLLRQTHDTLVEAVRQFPSADLNKQAGSKTSTTYADLITGIVLHDTYHIGQIQLMKRLARDAGIN